MKLQGQAEVRACLPAAFASVCLAAAAEPVPLPALTERHET